MKDVIIKCLFWNNTCLFFILCRALRYILSFLTLFSPFVNIFSFLTIIQSVMFSRVATRTVAAICRQRVATKISHRFFSVSSLQRTLVRPMSIHSFSPFLQSKRNINIDVLDTPNPKSLKFVPDCPILEEDQGVSSVVLSSQKEAQAASPFLGYPLLLIEGVSHVMLGADFVTVTLQEGYEWISTKPQIYQVLTEFSESGKSALVDGWKDTSSQEHPIDPEDEEAVALIKEIIELRVRPSVMEDGGDIEFIKFDENRIVWLLMKGTLMNFFVFDNCFT